MQSDRAARYGNLVPRIMAYEEGSLDPADELLLLADLVRSGVIYSLQGSYQRAAAAAIATGQIGPHGEVFQGD